MLTSGSRKMEFRHDTKPKLNYGWYWKTETKLSDGFPQSPTLWQYEA